MRDGSRYVEMVQFLRELKEAIAMDNSIHHIIGTIDNCANRLETIDSKYIHQDDITEFELHGLFVAVAKLSIELKLKCASWHGEIRKVCSFMSYVENILKKDKHNNETCVCTLYSIIELFELALLEDDITVLKKHIDTFSSIYINRSFVSIPDWPKVPSHPKQEDKPRIDAKF